MQPTQEKKKKRTKTKLLLMKNLLIVYFLFSTRIIMINSNLKNNKQITKNIEIKQRNIIMEKRYFFYQIKLE